MGNNTLVDSHPWYQLGVSKFNGNEPACSNQRFAMPGPFT